MAAPLVDPFLSGLIVENHHGLDQVRGFILHELQGFRDMLARGDTEGMRAKMRLSTERRAMFDKRQGSVVYC